jgi:predicted Rossmann-fold nucleotide-binding protein
MVYHCEALVVTPSGFGALDELFEVLTLRQTRKIQSNLPAVLPKEQYWETIINWQVTVYQLLSDIADKRIHRSW